MNKDLLSESIPSLSGEKAHRESHSQEQVPGTAFTTQMEEKKSTRTTDIQNGST